MKVILIEQDIVKSILIEQDIVKSILIEQDLCLKYFDRTRLMFKIY